MSRSRKECAIKECSSSSTEESKDTRIGLFKVPTSSLEKWQSLMPSTKLTNKSKICSRHFEKDDIVTGVLILNVFHPFQRWRLKKGSLPKNFLTPDKTTSKKKCQRLQNIHQEICNHNSKSSSVPVRAVTLPPLKVKQAAVDRQSSHLKASDTEYSNENESLSQSQSTSVQAIPQPLLRVDHIAVDRKSCLSIHNDLSSCVTLIDTEHSYGKKSSSPVQSTSVQAVPQPPLNMDHTPVNEQLGVSICNESSHLTASDSENESSLHDDGRKSCFETNFVTFQSLKLKVELPICWVWSFDDFNNTIFCSRVEILYDGSILQKTVRVIENQKIWYYLNGKSVSGSDLPNSFTSIEEISNVISKFNTKQACAGIVEQNLFTMAKTSRLSCFRDSSGGCMRSRDCRYVAGKTKLCDRCRQLKNYLLKQLRASLKKSPTMLKNKRGLLSAQMQKKKLDECRRRILSLQINEQDLLKNLRKKLASQSSKVKACAKDSKHA